MLIYYDWKNGSHDKKFMGIRPCINCNNLTEQYLTRTYFMLRIFFIPIFFVYNGRYLRCGGCGMPRKCTRKEWKALKAEIKGMPNRKKYLAAYEELKALVFAADSDNLDADCIYAQLLAKLPFTDDAGHIRKLVDTYLEYYIAEKQSAAANAEAHEVTFVAPENSAALLQNSDDTAPVRAVTDDGQPAVNQTENVTDVSAVQSLNGFAQPANAASGAILPGMPSQYYENTSAPRNHKLRKLWLLLAIPFAIFTLILVAASISIISDDIRSGVFEGVDIIIDLFMVSIPGALSYLFFWLSFRKD